VDVTGAGERVCPVARMTNETFAESTGMILILHIIIIIVIIIIISVIVMGEGVIGRRRRRLSTTHKYSYSLHTKLIQYY